MVITTYFKIHYNATIIKNVELKSRKINRSIEQNIKLGLNLRGHWQLILEKCAKYTQERMNSLFSRWYWDYDILIYIYFKSFDKCLMPFTKNLNWIIHININPKVMKLLGEILRENPCDTGLSKTFLARTTKAYSIEENLINWTLWKINTLLFKRHCEESKNTYYRLEKYFLQITYLIKDLWIEYIKTSQMSIIRKYNKKI